MLKKRVIPVLLLADEGLVKGELFKNHRYVGDPINAVRIFNEKEVNELVLLDISASSSTKHPNFELIEDIASEAFMPIGYGGSVNHLDQALALFRLGVEKVIINSEFHRNPSFVAECSNIAGAQSVIVSIDVKKGMFGSYSVYIDNGTRKIDINPVEYAIKAQEYGAGEILLTSIDREGIGKGLDIHLLQLVSSAVDIPVIAHGGVGKMSHIKESFTSTDVSAVAAGSFFTFHGKHKAVLLTYPSTSELKALIST